MSTGKRYLENETLKQEVLTTLALKIYINVKHVFRCEDKLFQNSVGLLLK